MLEPAADNFTDPDPALGDHGVWRSAAAETQWLRIPEPAFDLQVIGHVSNVTMLCPGRARGDRHASDISGIDPLTRTRIKYSAAPRGSCVITHFRTSVASFRSKSKAHDLVLSASIELAPIGNGLLTLSGIEGCGLSIGA